MKEPVFNHTAHRQLWYWIAGLKASPDGCAESPNEFWLQANKHEPMRNHCFACQYALEKSESSRCKCICEHCPLDWGTHNYCLHPSGNTLYHKRTKAKVFSAEWRELSMAIATLPVKDGVKVI